MKDQIPDVPGADTGEPAGPPSGGQHDFPCANCGAATTWDPESDALVCDYCDHRQAVPRAEGTILERPLEDAGEAARGLGLEVRVVQCDGCGARVALEEHLTSARCVYCGSSSVLAQDANRNAIRPESLVPLEVGRERAGQAFRSWLKGLWFRPNDLRRQRDFAAVGVYVPYWSFDCRVRSEWSADAGYYYWVTRTYTVIVDGKPRTRTRRVRKIRWVPKWGSRRDTFDDLLIAASRGLDGALLDELGGFDLAELEPYRPEYLAGWRAEEYQLDLLDGWTEAEHRVESIQRQRCAADVPGDTHRNLRVQSSIQDVRWKHVLLPLWSLQYGYKGETYTVLVHGQSGRVVGEAPLSWVKILLLVLALAAATLLVVFRERL